MKGRTLALIAILGSSACAPDLSANGAQRCNIEQPCAEGDVCYRGFCLPEVGRVLGPSDASIVYVEVESDGSIVLIETTVTAPAPDEPARQLPGSSTLSDAGTKSLSDASVQTPDAHVPPGRADAAVPPGRADAGIPRPDAALGAPDAALSCTPKECCDEAEHFYEDERGKTKKKCGCDNLIQALACGLF